jgi:hypothetical protein
LTTAAKKRANKWQRPEAAKELNPLGQRLLQLVLQHPTQSPREFARDALGSDTQAGNLSTQLERLRADDPEASLSGNQLVQYARYARVSLVWLLTGEGLPTQGPFGEPTEEEMLRYPEGLQRAARAMMELDNIDVKVAQWVADEALARYRGELFSPDHWLGVMRAIHASREQSGLRPSTRIKR